MTDDPKINFYLKHREQIEEWAELRVAAAELLDKALLAGVYRLAADDRIPTPSLTEGRDIYAKIFVETASVSDAAIELGWSPSSLLALHGGWPSLRIAVNPSHSQTLREAVKTASISGYVKHGLNQSTRGWWLRWGELKPDVANVFDVEGFANQCVDRWLDAYLDLAPHIRTAIEQHVRDA